MGSVFACPECGHELSLQGLTPGREVQCPVCATLVEVPYLPRAAGWKRGRRTPRGSPWWDSKLLKGAILFAAVALVGLAASGMIGARVRSDRERVLAELIASADQAEAAGKLDAALYQVEAALAQARTMDSRGSGRLAELLLRRNRASLREAWARLDAVAALDPDRAVGESLTLAERARTDRSLDPIGEAIEAQVQVARIRQARADLEIARRALDASDGAGAFAAAERLHDRAGHLPEAEARRFRDDAEGVLDAAVGRFGVAIPAVSGRLLAGSVETFDAALVRPLTETLARRGYLVPPRRPAWRSLWDRLAPFRATVRVVEEQEGYYLQSRNRTTLLEGFFELNHRGRTAWQSRIAARTRSPLPDLPAYLAGRLATSDRHDPEVERRFRADALAGLVEQAARVLRGLPARETAERTP